MSAIPNVLAGRYASEQMRGVWAPEAKVVAERRLWIAVLQAQRELGVDIPDGVVDDYERVVQQVDLESIAARERRTRHDVKARIEEFSALAGHEHIHKGMTSRDLTENVEQLQVRESLLLIRTRMIATITRLGELAAQHRRGDAVREELGLHVHPEDGVPAAHHLRPHAHVLEVEHRPHVP